MRGSPALSSRGILVAIVLAIIVSLQIGMIAGGFNANKATAAPAASAEAKNLLRSFQDAFTSIADQVEPSIVFIESERTVRTQSDPFEDFWRRFGMPSPRGGGQSQTQKASGSGVIVRADGYILTNDHVVGGMDRVTVTLSDKREFKGKVLRDPTTDLALIKIDANNLPAVSLGDSDKVRPGQWALAFGNPGGQQFTNSLTVGIVSAVTREFAVPDPDSPQGRRVYPDAIQTDAAINPGNSGGPLINLDGQIIGINSAIWSPTGASVGIGFAIPANTAKYVMQQLIATGKVGHGRLGVHLKDLDSNLGQHYGARTGALVTSVDKGTAADKAGVKPEDVITTFNGKQIASTAALISAVEKTAPGTKATLGIVRDKKPVTLSVTVGAPTEEASADNTSGSDELGLTVSELTANVARQLGVPTTVKGVLVESVEGGSAGDRAGFEEGDVITKIAGKPTATVAAFNAATAGLKAGDKFVASIQRGKVGDILSVELE